MFLHNAKARREESHTLRGTGCMGDNGKEYNNTLSSCYIYATGTLPGRGVTRYVFFFPLAITV